MQLPLKLSKPSKEFILMGEPSAKVEYFPQYVSSDPQVLDQYFLQLKEEIKWRQDQITLYGKTHNVPRLQAWYSDNGSHYSYSGIDLIPELMTGVLLELKAKLTQFLSVQLNSALCNLYRDGNDYVAWHSDNEKELGPEPVICSLSFGVPRKFSLKHVNKGEDKKDIILNSGDLLVMSGRTQDFYLHQIPRSKKVEGERINLTFRNIIRID